MNSIVTATAALSLFAALAIAQSPHYTVRDLGALGPNGQPFFITRNSLVSGAVNLPDGTEHAVLWFQGIQIDIAKPGLGGRNSISFGVNSRGQFVGQAQTSISDPYVEDFCGFKATGLPVFATTCMPFLWQNGVMTALPTLGGHNGVASIINSRGEVAGLAENTTRDTACPAPQQYQFRPVIWQSDGIHELPINSADPEGIAFAINDNGDAVGGSGKCSSFNPSIGANLQPLHALLWQTGTLTDLGNLGGTGQGNGIIATNLNNQGQVVGFSDLKGDKTFHAFLWSKATGMQDLGALHGDVNSSAIGINDSGDVTGASIDADFNPRAFLLHNGVMYDLTSLTPASSSLFLLFACSINARGDIVGLAVDTGTGDLHGYLATPDSNASAGDSETSPRVLREDLRQMIRQLPFGRLGIRPPEQQ